MVPAENGMGWDGYDVSHGKFWGYDASSRRRRKLSYLSRVNWICRCYIFWDGIVVL